MHIIDGKKIAQEILFKLKSDLDLLEINRPKLGIIQVGDDEATNIYVKHKVNDAKKIGMDAEVFFSIDSTYEKLEELIKELNTRKDISGFIIQFPLPIEGDIKELLLKIDPKKDVDGLNPLSLGEAWQGQKGAFVPATVLGIMECLKHVSIFSDETYSVDELDEDTVENKLNDYLKGKDIVIINHSIIVGKPLAGLLVNAESTVSICHKETKNLKNYTKNADIIISATGKAGLINSEMIKEKAIIIDVGINRINGVVKGDIDFESVRDKAAWVTPVPGGVGPLTRAMLLWNTWLAFKRNK